MTWVEYNDAGLDHTELISNYERWQDIRNRINHLSGQGYIVKLDASLDLLKVFKPARPIKPVDTH